MDQRVSLITLGVSDLKRSLAFYRALGWEPVGEQGEDIAFFQAGGMALALWSREKLAEDSCVVDGGGWGGITLAYCVPDRDEVDAVMDQARRAGARMGREPDDMFWGGYSGVFVDPDGHPWEVAWNPGWSLDASGSLRL